MKDIPPNYTDDCFEDPDLRKFELFLDAATDHNDLSFISKGTSSSEGKFLASDGVPLFHSHSTDVGRNHYHTNSIWTVCCIISALTGLVPSRVRYHKEMKP